MQHRERRRLGCVLEDADKGPVEAQLPPPAHHWHCSAHCSSGKSTDVANTTLSVVPAVCLASITVPDKCALYNSNLANLAGSKCCKLEHAD